MEKLIGWYKLLCFLNVLVVTVVLVLGFGTEGAAALVPFKPQHSTGYCQLFVRSNGYTCTEVVVETGDGYLLALQRIVSLVPATMSKGPVFLYHGIMEGGEIWVLNPGEESLAFSMASAGYEVWVGNSRSSNYTYGHVTYSRQDKDNGWRSLGRRDLEWETSRERVGLIWGSVDQECPGRRAYVVSSGKQVDAEASVACKYNKNACQFVLGGVVKVIVEYWNWNWDDLVTTDLPTMLQFVSQHTRQPIYYVGYSQGTMTALAAFSQGGTVNLVAKVALLSPIGSLNHVTSPLVTAASWLFVDEIMLAAGVAEFSAYSSAGQKFIDITCTAPEVDCRHDLMTQITGPNCCFNETRVLFYNRYELQSTSMRNLAQMAQMVRSGRFAKFDYGFWGNLEKYSSLWPPEYDVTAIPPSLPIMLAHGGSDSLADPNDVAQLISNLRGTPQVLYLANYAHADFVMGTTARTDVYSHILTFFQT